MCKGCVYTLLPSAGIIRIRFKGMISARSIKAPHFILMQRYDLLNYKIPCFDPVFKYNFLILLIFILLITEIARE